MSAFGRGISAVVSERGKHISRSTFWWWSVVQPFLIVGFKIGLHGQTVDRCVHIMAWCLHCWVPQYLVRAVSKHHHIRKYYLRPPWLGCVLNSGCCLMTASGCQKPQISTKPKLTVVFTGIHWGCIIRIFFFSLAQSVVHSLFFLFCTRLVERLTKGSHCCAI